MANVTRNALLNGARGSFNKKMVFRTYNGQTYSSAHPDMSNRKLSPAQKASIQAFREAVAYAKKILDDPEQRSRLLHRMKNNKKLRNMFPRSVLIQEFLLKHHDTLSERATDRLVLRYLEKYQLTVRQQAGLHYLLRFKKLDNETYRNINKVSKPTATRDLKEMVTLGVLFCTGKGAGAYYELKDVIEPEPQAKEEWAQEDE